VNILVIEDSRFLRTAIERALTKTGHQVTGVADGEEGLQLASTGLPALIFLDMMLPGMDGTCVLRKLKQNPSTAQIPVVVLTGLSQKNERKLKQEGAAAYIDKATLDLEKSANILSHTVEMILGSAPASSSPAKRQGLGTNTDVERNTTTAPVARASS
jgi:CheY-like chemotaxis protein